MLYILICICSNSDTNASLFLTTSSSPAMAMSFTVKTPSKGRVLQVDADTATTIDQFKEEVAKLLDETGSFRLFDKEVFVKGGCVWEM